MPPLKPAETYSPFSAPPGRAPWWWVSILLILALVWGLFCTEPIQRWTGLRSAPLWADAQALLAMNDAHRAGFDVHQPNPSGCLHLYTSLWLHLGDWGLSSRHETPFALAIVSMFLIPGLILLRPRNLRETLWYLAFFSSAPVLLGLHRANSDLLLFGLLAAVVPCLRSDSRKIQALAPVLIVFAAALKYYPLVAACVLFVEPEKERRRWLLLVLGLALALALAAIHDDFRHIAGSPQATGLKVSYGAPIFLNMLGVPGKLASLLGLGLGAAIAAATWWWKSAGEWTKAVATDWRYRSLILSASILAGCYWAGGNWSYRLIALYGLLPFVLEPPGTELMPPALKRLQSPVRWLLGVSLTALTAMALLFWALWQKVSYEALMTLWDITNVLLHLCYFPLALYCTVVVAQLFFTRLRSGL